jgi:hypothetical protein
MGKVIGIDFDGVVVPENFPHIIGFMPEAKETITDLYNAGYILVLWTSRTNTYKDENGQPGMYLQKAIDFLTREGIFQYFVAVNENVKPGCDCQKILADYYIDDRNLGGFPGWKEVRRILLK